VQCVLNFADNLEEDGGTIIVPRFHKHVKVWCAENVLLRKQVPFLVFEKPRIKIEAVSDVQNFNPACLSVSASASASASASGCVNVLAGDAGSMRNDEIQRLHSNNQKSKNLFKVGRGGGGRGQPKAPVSTVDHEAPLLALAHRIPMRQVSSLFKCSIVQMFKQSNGDLRDRVV
jgi:hypothetical protein